MSKKVELKSLIRIGSFIILALTFLVIEIPQYGMQKKVSDVQVKLSELELDVKSIKDRQNIVHSSIRITSDLIDIIHKLHPQITVENTQAVYKNNMVILSFTVNNHGNLGVVVEKPRIVITTEPLVNQVEVKGELIEGKDYHFSHDLPICYLGPNQTNPHTKGIIFEDVSLLSDRVFIMLTITANTDPKIVEVAATFLKDFYTREDLLKRAEFKYVHTPLKVTLRE